MAMVALTALGLSAQAGLAAPEGNGVPDDLERQMDDLERRIDRLEAESSRTWLTERRAQEIRNLVVDVLQDADTRAARLSDARTAGWDDQYFITDEDGEFRLEFSGQMQLRYVYTHRRGSGEDDNTSGLEVRRLKFKVRGHILTPRFRYAASVANVREVGVFELQDAYLEYDLTDELVARIGRFRSPLLREYAVSSKRQMLVERSLIARTFRQDRQEGVALRGEWDSVRIFLAFMDADQRLPENDSWVASGRVEVLLAGRFKELKDLTSFPEDEPVVALGGGLLYQDREVENMALVERRVRRWTADLSIELGGASILGAVVGNHVKEPGEDRLEQWGVVVQGGVFIADQWELFGRYVWGDADGEARDLSVVTFGLNRYVLRHRLKWTADVGYGLNQVDDFWDSDGAGWQDDGDGKAGQIVVRVQVQALF
jgi:hypothetical protein